MFLAIDQMNSQAAKRRIKENKRRAAAHVLADDGTGPIRGGTVTMSEGETQVEAEMRAAATIPTETSTAIQRPPLPSIGASASVASSASNSTSSSTANLIDDMLLDIAADSATITASAKTTNIVTKLTGEKLQSTAKCKKCQHTISNGKCRQLYEQSGGEQLHTHSKTSALSTSHSGCRCECDCVNKSLYSFASTVSPKDKPTFNLPTPSPSTSSTTAPTSLYAVYMCLGTLALAVATLSVLFYSHVHSTGSIHRERINDQMPMAPTPTDANLNLMVFREQFQSELLASEHVLRAIVSQVLDQREGIQKGQAASGQNVVFGGVEPIRSYQQRATRATEAEKAATMLADDGTLVRNERKYVGHIRHIADTPTPIFDAETAAVQSSASRVGRRLRRDITSSPASMQCKFAESMENVFARVISDQGSESVDSDALINDALIQVKIAIYFIPGLLYLNYL